MIARDYRREAIETLAGSEGLCCSVPGCYNDELQIDHIYNDGAFARKRSGTGNSVTKQTTDEYRWIVKNGPAAKRRFQLLCNIHNNPKIKAMAIRNVFDDLQALARRTDGRWFSVDDLKVGQITGA